MIFITGGAAQGKRDYVSRRFGLAPADILDGAHCEPAQVAGARCVIRYESLVRRLLIEGASPEAFTRSLIRTAPRLIVVQTEIGCGIVPLDPDDRTWREQAGRCGCLLAAAADEVVRLHCGIPVHLKGGSA